jgi:putative tricarboxylic transport membrane protein
MFDIYVALATGALGYFLTKFGFGIGPLVLGFVLGPMAEAALRRTITLGETHGSTLELLFGRPVSLILMALVLFIVGSALIKELSRRKDNRMRILKDPS